MDPDSAAILFEARELPAKTVIVYADRAEVKREIEVDFDKKGTYTLLIQNLSPVIERQSIRVEGIRLAEISQVQYEEQPLTEKTTIHLELNQFETEKLDKERQKIEIDDELHVLRKRLDVLDGVAGQVGQNALSIRDSASSDPQNNNNYVHPSFLLCNEAMQNLGQFLEYYSKSASDLRHELREKESQLKNIISQIDTLERQIDQLRCRLEYDNHKRNLRIVVEVPEAGQAQIYLCYQVYCVSWRPAYDFRASTSQGASTKEFTKLDMDTEGDSDSSSSSQHSNLSSPNDAQIYYYGLIEQKTDENWENVELVLSTAQPCIAGTLPPLPTLTASFQKQPSLFRQRQLSAQRRPLSNGSEEDIGIGSFEYECTDAAALQRLTIARSSSDSELNQNRDQLPCSYFSIEQAATIPCDGQHHRVLIAHLRMQPQFMHETNPSKTSSALLSALVVNTTQIALLNGQASVFLNNSFICQSQLKTVLPGEQFCCALGVDASVKLEYKPAKRTNEKIGFMSKSSLTTHEQVISVRNAKVGERIHLTVREPIPKPVDDKIKVTILSPDLRTGRTEACLSKDNHLEWVCTLEAGQQQDLCIKWTTECPLNESVVYTTSSGITGQPATSHQYHQLMGSQQRVY